MRVFNKLFPLSAPLHMDHRRCHPFAESLIVHIDELPSEGDSFREAPSYLEGDVGILDRSTRPPSEKCGYWGHVSNNNDPLLVYYLPWVSFVAQSTLFHFFSM